MSQASPVVQLVYLIAFSQVAGTVVAMARRTATLSLSSWVTQQPKPLRRASAALTSDVIDMLSILRDPQISETTRSRVIAIIDRTDQVGIGVPLTAAAELLDVSTQTLRTWVERGILDTIPETRPVEIRPRSLAEVTDAVSVLRSDEGASRRVLHDLLDLREIESLDDRIGELAQRTPLDPGRIEEQLFS